MTTLDRQLPENEETVLATRLRRTAFTLVELLTAIGIALVLMAMLFPALTAAREASRNSACKNNLRQLGVGLQDNAALDGRYCTGAFDWFEDGCVTDIGWVADLVKKGSTVGKMLCPSNPAKTSETYWDLLSGDAIGAATCTQIDMLGGASYMLPDGITVVSNPCREILETPLAPDSEARRLAVEEGVYNDFYNTNYTASWFLVRMGVDLESNGNLKTPPGACGTASPSSVFSTFGPLEQRKVDLLDAPSNTLPLLGCGTPVPGLLLPMAVGDAEQGSPMAESFTDGPVRIGDLSIPSFPATAPKMGAIGVGWWATWNDTRQDYRGFAPVHRGVCNLLFTDGSVRSVKDTNRDGYLNNGFPAIGGFVDDKVELPNSEVFSRWSLQGPFSD